MDRDLFRRIVEYHQHRGDGLEREGERKDESANWSGIQDEEKRTKNSCGTQQDRAGMREEKVQKLLSHLTRKQRSDK